MAPPTEKSETESLLNITGKDGSNGSSLVTGALHSFTVLKRVYKLTILQSTIIRLLLVPELMHFLGESKKVSTADPENEANQ
jgi:hypothetical protein